MSHIHYSIYIFRYSIYPFMEPRCTVVFNQVILVLVSYIEYINIIWPFADTVIINHSTINLLLYLGREDTLRFSTAIY